MCHIRYPGGKRVFLQGSQPGYNEGISKERSSWSKWRDPVRRLKRWLAVRRMTRRMKRGMTLGGVKIVRDEIYHR